MEPYSDAFDVIQKDQISLFQGFRANYPQISKEQKDSPVNTIHDKIRDLKSIQESRRNSISSCASQSTRASHRLPSKAHQQAAAMKNIALIFSDLLNERDTLLVESDAAEEERLRAETELRHVEDMLTEYAAVKSKIIENLERIVSREDTIAKSSI